LTTFSSNCTETLNLFYTENKIVFFLEFIKTMTMKILRVVLFGLGLFLLLINLIGLFKSLRNPDLYTEEKTGRLNDITIKLEDAKKQIIRKSGENDKEFAFRINDVVSKSMMHYWKEDGIEKYNMRVPVWENYILYTVNSFNKDKRYEFINYKKALERGVGLCSTHSIVVKGILLNNKIEAQLWDIAGHVVVRAKISENEWCILDPDYGLIVPHDIAEIEANPEVVRPTYAEMAKLYKPDYKDPYTTDHVVEIYGKEGNHIYTYNPFFENSSYIAKWLLPLLLILPYGLSLVKMKS
jgi:hypothetical protein